MDIPAKYQIATAEQSRTIDAATIEEFGIDGFTLMETAGSSAAKKIQNEMQPGSHGVFLCGKGNNGGDALVAARYLVQQKIGATVVFISGTDDLSPTAQKNYELLQNIKENDGEALVNFIPHWPDFDVDTNTDFIIDGMLGTGLNSNLRGDYTDAVQWANDQSCPVFAMDMPTGIHTDTGRRMGDAVKATQTFAFGLLKQGYYLNDGKTHTGTIHFCALPFPRYLTNQCSAALIDESWNATSSEEPARHKYEAGIVYIIAGSEGLTGAALMAAKSAWAEGVGAVMLICPRGTLSVFENNLPQIIKKPVGQKGDVFFKQEHLKEVQEIVSEKEGAVVIGPGMGRKESTVEFINEFLMQNTSDLIVDADALWALSKQEKWRKPDSSSWILTPHPGELSTLTGTDITDDHERLTLVQHLAQEKDITLLSKGFPVIVGTSSGNLYLTGYDTRIFSRAGFGDVLAGKIVGYKSMKNQPEKSCILALLKGKSKAFEVKKEKGNTLEPLDLI